MKSSPLLSRKKGKVETELAISLNIFYGGTACSVYTIIRGSQILEGCYPHQPRVRNIGLS